MHSENMQHTREKRTSKHSMSVVLKLDTIEYQKRLATRGNRGEKNQSSIHEGACTFRPTKKSIFLKKNFSRFHRTLTYQKMKNQTRVAYFLFSFPWQKEKHIQIMHTFCNIIICFKSLPSLIAPLKFSFLYCHKCQGRSRKQFSPLWWF